MLRKNVTKALKDMDHTKCQPAAFDIKLNTMKTTNVAISVTVSASRNQGWINPSCACNPSHIMPVYSGSGTAPGINISHAF